MKRKQLVLLTLVAAVAPASGALDDNAAEFRALCDVYNLYQQKAKMTEDSNSDSMQPTLERLIKANLSTATETYFNNKDGAFTKEGKTDEQSIQKWREEANKMVSEEDTKTKAKKSTRMPPSEARSAANKRIMELHRDSENVLEEYKAAVAIAKAARQEAAAYLTYAIFGDNNTDLTEDKIPSTTKQMCGNAAGGHADVGQGIAHALTCLCSVTTGANNECAKGLTTTGNQGSQTATQTAENWKTIAEACSKRKSSMTPTPELLEAITVGVEAHLGRQPNGAADGDNAYVLGKLGASSVCDMGTNKACINYKTQMTTGTKDVAWQRNLRKAAMELRKAADLDRQAKLHKIHLQHNDEAAATILLTAELTSKAASTSTLSPSPRSNQQSAPGEESKCKPQNNSAEECPSEHCNYDTKTKECKPKKTGSETPAAAGTGDASSGVDCSKHQTQQACEAENKDVKQGQKAVCGWIDYVEGTGKLPKPECRSSSFLLNEKFALSVVSAAFAALLF
uniref:Variant surface glycoprotein Mul 1 n=1 Tax=Trypanosoma brucei rhodesiense TaxID=31286 RepID=Q571W9_TRYBR|nr:variant surface glycoprotein Mul 1 [Trypanosoma brucei rhodesiense]